MRNQKGFSLIELLIVVAIIGIISAIAVPSLLRARMASNEAAAIGDTRTVISADATFASANNGCYASDIKFLSAPPDDHGSVVYLDTQMGVVPGVKQGYTRNYLATLTAPACCRRILLGVPTDCGDTGTASFSYTADPLTFAVTGMRAFSGDMTGLVCQCNPAGSSGCTVGGTALGNPANCTPT